MADLICEKEAHRIYQDLLDRICDAYFSDDFAAFKTLIHTPHVYRTETTEQRIETVEQMEQAFACFRDYLLGVGVTDFLRNCIGATALTPTKILGGHITDLLSNGTRLRDPYEVWATVELIDGAWRVTGSQNAVADTSWQSHAFRQGAQMKHESPAQRA